MTTYSSSINISLLSVVGEISSIAKLAIKYSTMEIFSFNVGFILFDIVITD